MKRVGHLMTFLALAIISLAVAACETGTAVEEGRAKHRTSAERTTREVTDADPVGCPASGEPASIEADAQAALEADARSYAEDEGIPVDKARRRLRTQQCFADDVADLERALRSEEADTFAGLWGQEDGYVVLFTRDGKETIRPYLEGEPERFRRLFEVRSGAEATAAELEATQRQVGRVFDRLKNENASSATNVKKNRVEVYVKDKERFEARLREEGVVLPEHVVVVESGLCCLRPGPM